MISKAPGPQLRAAMLFLIALHPSLSCYILGQIIRLTAFKTLLIMGFYDRVMQYLFANWERKIIIRECRSRLRNSFRPVGTMLPYMLNDIAEGEALPCDPVLWVEMVFLAGALRKSDWLGFLWGPSQLLLKSWILLVL